MAKVTFIVGLCGSGKTHLSERLAAETGARLFEGLVEKQTTDLPTLLDCLRSGNDCIVEEISFCFECNRDAITQILKQHVSDVHIEWVCIANDLASANWNVTHRDKPGDDNYYFEINQRVHDGYTYPAGCTLVPITRTGAVADAAD